MISKLRVQGFKRFDDKEFKLSSLTVLAGLNGAGKTSLIQSLLVTQQCSNSSVVQLNGPFGLELGTAEDVSNWAGAPDTFLRASWYWRRASSQGRAPCSPVLMRSGSERKRNGSGGGNGFPSFGLFCDSVNHKRPAN
ncbi:ATP-binding protein [Cupriavidus necator]|uniref:AAA family ATPase n=1 Tax=Cupriavidus necator TaxID=106590 RepID=UPI000F4D9D69